MFPVATLFDTGTARTPTTRRRFTHPAPDEPDVTLEYQHTPGVRKPHMIVRTVAMSFPKVWYFERVEDARAKWVEVETEMMGGGYESIG